MAGSSSAAPAGGGGGAAPDDDLQTLLASLPDFDANQRLQQVLLEKHLRRQRELAALQVAVRRGQREAEEQAEEEAAAETRTAEMRQLAAQLTVGVDLDELREHEAVLAPLPPAQPADFELDAAYLEATSAAAQALGLDLDAEGVAEEPPLEGRQVARELFWAGLRSGLVRSLALQRGEAGRELVGALLATLTQGPDAETAGAAFVTLLALLGDDGIGPAAGEDSAPEGSEGARGRAAVAPPRGLLLLDAHSGLPSQRAAAVPLPPCTVACLPSDAQLFDGLKANGYCPGGVAGAAAGRGGRQPGGEVAAAQRRRPSSGGSGSSAAGEARLAVRLQAIKLLLRTAAAVCHYCRRHPGSPAAQGALTREGLPDLLLSAIHLGLDPAAAQLQPDCDAAVAALLPTFDAGDWQRRLPQLADRLSRMGPSVSARLKLMRRLPTAQPRGLALQQWAAALLLERAMPGGQPVAPPRGGELDPTATIAAQPWFADGKALVAGATSGAAAVPRGGYSIGKVELLLKLCHLLLWPHMLACAQDERSPLTAAFLRRWLAFLKGCQKGVRSMLPEDQAVKALALHLDLEYGAAAGGAGSLTALVAP